jgi:FkbM family methyltransferase
MLAFNGQKFLYVDEALMETLENELLNESVDVYEDLPRGIDCFKDIAKALPDYEIDVAFDVGANIGQSALHYLQRLPRAKVYCFEPVSDNFKLLKKNLSGFSSAYLHQLALAASSGKGAMALQGNCDMFFLISDAKKELLQSDSPVEEVTLSTLDQFCKENAINRISYLKVDTEGADLEVLKGGVGMLAEQSIDFLELEAGMNPYNKWHVPIEELKVFLESYGYYVFGIYEQMHEWPKKKIHLRRVNPVFVSQRMIDQGVD